jgi:hypothetical protein
MFAFADMSAVVKISTAFGMTLQVDYRVFKRMCLICPETSTGRRLRVKQPQSTVRRCQQWPMRCACVPHADVC